MRIQHNIMAINAYRNYNTNTSALSKNLEKLSSGYKINRAGDDAAGLAISEKMRAQITGLNAAQKNVKDGVSLVKTAEGAMQEIQDMLNRMDYLATQSANGTYDNEVDRANLQKEVDALKTEINRIADSANFNGIKLLDGSLDAGTYTGKISGKVLEGKPTILAGDATDPFKEVGTKTVLKKEGSSVAKTELTVNMHNVVIENAQAGDKIKLELGDVSLELEVATTATAANKITASDAADSTKLASKFATLFAAAAASGGADGKISEQAFGATASGSEITFKQTNDPKIASEVVDAAIEAKVSFTPGQSEATTAKKATVTTTDGVAAGSAGFTAGTASTGKTEDVLATIDFTAATIDAAAVTALGNGFTFGGVTVKVTSGLTANTTTGAEALAAVNTAITAAVAAHNTAGASGAATYNKIENAVAAAKGNTGLTVTYDSTPQNYTAAAASTAAKAEVDFGTMTGADAIGDKVTVGGKTYEFVSTGGTASGSNVKVEVASDATAGQIATALATAAGASTAKPAAVNTVAAAGTKVTFTTTATGSAAKLAATSTDSSGGQKVGTPTGTWNVSTTKNKQGAIESAGQLASTKITLSSDFVTDGGKLTIGKNTYVFAVGEKSTVKAEGTGEKLIDLKDVDASDTAAVLKAAGMALSNEDGTVFDIGFNQTDNTLSIHEHEGQTIYKAELKDHNEFQKLISAQSATKDTSDEFNQMKVSIGDMHTTKMGTVGGKSIDGISVASQTDAAEAVQTIKDAINYVSSVRGDLGAIQNRLEHTGNNLSVMAENIQDAESTIRDTDVAEEMMSYVKNNILVQSAQAMLAQANQVPQGVLQLLG